MHIYKFLISVYFNLFVYILYYMFIAKEYFYVTQKIIRS